MSYVSIGDLALNFHSRRQNVEIKSDLQRLAQELASGHRADISTAASGDLQPVASLERAMQSARAFHTSISEAALVAGIMQSALEMVQDNSSELGPAMLAASSSENPLLIETTSADSRFKFEAALSAFNTRVADRYAFSGVTTDVPAFADAGTILASLQTAIAAETTALGVETAVDAWFDTSGGGFETVAYTGSNTKLAPVRLSQNDTVQFDLIAADSDVREILKGFALAALVGEGTLSADITERAMLARISGEQLLTTESSLSVLRARIGSTEARIDEISSNNSAETASLEIARSELTAVDPFRAATELEAVRGQLETFYTLTARLSQLSLADYLR